MSNAPKTDDQAHTASECIKCAGCARTEPASGGWCYMFGHRPDHLPCAHYARLRGATSGPALAEVELAARRLRRLAGEPEGIFPPDDTLAIVLNAPPGPDIRYDREQGAAPAEAEPLSEEQLDTVERNCDRTSMPAARHVQLDRVFAQARRCLAAEEHGVMADQCLGMVSEALATLGCGCGPDAHAATPPMMFPEWICCVVAHHKAGAALRAAKALADASLGLGGYSEILRSDTCPNCEGKSPCEWAGCEWGVLAAAYREALAKEQHAQEDTACDS